MAYEGHVSLVKEIISVNHRLEIQMRGQFGFKKEKKKVEPTLTERN